MRRVRFHYRLEANGLKQSGDLRSGGTVDVGSVLGVGAVVVEAAAEVVDSGEVHYAQPARRKDSPDGADGSRRVGQMLKDVHQEDGPKGPPEGKTGLHIGHRQGGGGETSGGDRDGVLGDIYAEQSIAPGEALEEKPVAAANIEDCVAGGAGRRVLVNEARYASITGAVGPGLTGAGAVEALEVRLVEIIHPPRVPVGAETVQGASSATLKARVLYEKGGQLVRRS